LGKQTKEKLKSGKLKAEMEKRVNLSMLALFLLSVFCFLLSAFFWTHSAPVNSHLKTGLARIRVAEKKLKLGKQKAEMEKKGELEHALFLLSVFCFLLFFGHSLFWEPDLTELIGRQGGVAHKLLQFFIENTDATIRLRTSIASRSRTDGEDDPLSPHSKSCLP
jgi:hypothetical protein